MKESAIVLQVIHEELSRADAGIVGELALSEESLSIHGGAVWLGAEVHHDPQAHPAIAHCHVIAELGERGGPLDACIVGVHSQRREALADAGRVWVELVAGPILSLIHARPVMGAVHFDGTQPEGVSGCHGFAGPMSFRFFSDAFEADVLGNAPLFDYAAEMAPPGLVHIAKTTLTARGDRRWNRNLEVDGHAASHADAPWTQDISAPSQGVAAQFAVFHVADQSEWVEARRRVDDALRRFVTAFQETENTDAAANVLESEGVDADLVNQIAAFSPLALGRVVFASLGVAFPPEFLRIKADGSLEDGLMLMRQPVFARAKALGASWLEGELRDAVTNLALTGAELNTINSALNAGSRLEDLVLMPPIVPDPGATPEAISAAIRDLEERAQRQGRTPKVQKPWWRFW